VQKRASSEARQVTEKGIACNPQIKIPLEKYTPRLEDNIKIDLTEVRCKCVDWLNVAQNRDHTFHVIFCSTTHECV
jgi:hypothetical protein